MYKMYFVDQFEIVVRAKQKHPSIVNCKFLLRTKKCV